MIVVVALDAGIVSRESLWLFGLVTRGAVHSEVGCRFLHGDAGLTGSHGRKLAEGEPHAVLSLLEFVHVIAVTGSA